MNAKLSSSGQYATQLIYGALLNTYFQEFQKGALLDSAPQWDTRLVARLAATGVEQWMRVEIDFLEIYCPLTYHSATGRHAYAFPVLCLDRKSDGIDELSLDDFTAIVVQELELPLGSAEANCFGRRLAACVRNLAAILEHRRRDGARLPSRIAASFIETEQALILGHAMHPLAKDRSGFTLDDLRQYSPEFERPFQLHYFLCAPRLFVEQHHGSESASERLRCTIRENPTTPLTVRELLMERKDWKLFAAHPWEALYQLSTRSVRTLIDQADLIDLGRIGPVFHATSSLRTAWSPEVPFMLKFSLHAKLTNSIRVNHAWELPIGIYIARLLDTNWGRTIAREFPEVELIPDPSYYSLCAGEGGELLEGFSTIVRHNPFGNGTATRNIALLASLCQDGLFGGASRLANITNEYAKTHRTSVATAAMLWFKQYLAVFLRPLIQIYSRYGLALEAHQQNILLGLDENGFPCKTYFRDNQGYFIREGKRAEVQRFVPDFGEGCFIVHSEDHINPKFTYYLIINNLLGVIAAKGRAGVAKETDLISAAQDCLETLRPEDQSGLVSYILDSVFLTLKGNLSMSVLDMNEATQPIERPAVYLPYPNPFLFRKHYSQRILAPRPAHIVRTRYLAEHGATLYLRALDYERDLPLYHSWFHQDYAKPFWNMADPLEKLEVSYREQQSSLHSRAYTGLIDGDGVFAVEFYWAARDVIGRYYNVRPGDYGLHLLIAPSEMPKRNFSLHVLFLCLDFLFSDARVTRAVCEADQRNAAMDRLLERAGFRSQGIVRLPKKQAHLTSCTRESFRAKEATLLATPAEAPAVTLPTVA